MEDRDLNERIIARGSEFLQSVRGETPSVFNRGRWIGKVMDWCMRNEEFRVQMFRFVDVFPYLRSGEALTRHLQEYFAGDGSELPTILKWGAKSSGAGGALGGALLGKVIRRNIEEMARQFIVGDSTATAVGNIANLREEGFAFVVDVLGEATLNEDEAEAHVAAYLDLLNALAGIQARWSPLGGGDGAGLDWGHAPMVNVSVKPTALYSQARPQDLEGSVRAICARMGRIYEKVISLGGFLCIDMESYRYKEITYEVFRRLRLEHRDYPHLGTVAQSYLKDTDRDLGDLLGWARGEQVPISLRLVKGAYWDYETVLAAQNGWEIPVYTTKAQTDAAFERHARLILENQDICHLACASHNIRSVAAVMEVARELGVPDRRFEFQVLYGMAEPVRKGLLNVAGRIRLYCPYGEMVPGMAYLVRRLLENTSNESFVRKSFVEEAEAAQLLEDPKAVTAREQAVACEPAPAAERGGLPPFTNHPSLEVTSAAAREAFAVALSQVRTQLGRDYPLFIDGREVSTEERLSSFNPACPEELIGRVSLAGRDQMTACIAAAKAAFPNWRDTPPERRAGYLVKAAAVARRRIYELSAWQVLEIGKQWDQAFADVAEGIDFLEYYAREMVRLGEPLRVGHAPGEDSRYLYEPKGVAAVIAPWNFPFAISCGMAAAAIVTGNCVVYKPSGLTPVIGHHLVEIFREVGLPDGVFNYAPGRSGEVGDLLVEHPDLGLIAFTGSMEVGLHIIEGAARVQPGQTHVKRVIAEMGGKNAIIIDDDADLDQAVPEVLYGAFGFQGQKCSACSRVIALDSIHDTFVERLVLAARALKIGPAEDPANFMGAVADENQLATVLDYIKVARQEGAILHQSAVPARGHFAPLTIVGDITPQMRLAQEEVFGPVLAVMRARDFDQALEWANSTRFALTGGVFSRSPARLDRARREFRVGNLYLNRNCVGALVERHPFGGARMSGVGSKAGGPDYLLQFMDPRTITENTLRRGFAPPQAEG